MMGARSSCLFSTISSIRFFVGLLSARCATRGGGGTAERSLSGIVGSGLMGIWAFKDVLFALQKALL